MTDKSVVCGSCKYCTIKKDSNHYFFYCTFHEFNVSFTGKICNKFKRRER